MPPSFRPLRLALAALSLASAPLAPAAENILPRWREQFPLVGELVDRNGLDIIAYESPYDPLPELPAEFVARASTLLETLRPPADFSLVFDPIHGPETPFPDHHPLRQIASLRTVLVRHALADGDHAAALDLVRQNLRQARATLRAQEGILPYIHASGVWQAALDGVHAIVRDPAAIPDAMLRELLAELLADANLAALASAQALLGEYEHIYKVIVERMPATDDPDLFLSSVSSLGMAEPCPLEPGELGLGLTTHPILDVPATLSAYRADLAPYFLAYARSSRLPRGLYATHTAPALASHHDDLGLFLPYSTGELEPTLANLALARAALESTPNPGGKLLALFLTPPWEAILTNLARREAQRSALCALLAWRIHGGPTTWEILVAKKLLPAPPADPFSAGALLYSLAPEPRVWSVFSDGRDDGGKLVDGNYGQPDDLVWLP